VYETIILSPSFVKATRKVAAKPVSPLFVLDAINKSELVII